MNETKYTVQLDNKSVLTVKDLHREVLSDQKQALEEYKLEQKGLFSQHKNDDDIESIETGQGVWLSFKAWDWAIVVVIAFLAIAFGFGFLYARREFT